MVKGPKNKRLAQEDMRPESQDPEEDQIRYAQAAQAADDTLDIIEWEGWDAAAEVVGSLEDEEVEATHHHVQQEMGQIQQALVQELLTSERRQQEALTALEKRLLLLIEPAPAAAPGINADQKDRLLQELLEENRRLHKKLRTETSLPPVDEEDDDNDDEEMEDVAPAGKAKKSSRKKRDYKVVKISKQERERLRQINKYRARLQLLEKQGSDEKKRYPKRFDSYFKATEGIPREVVKERREKNLCTRCGRKGHNAKFCANEADNGSQPSTSDKDSKKATSSDSKVNEHSNHRQQAGTGGFLRLLRTKSIFGGGSPVIFLGRESRQHMEELA